jgi:hypothetical protein
MATRYVAKIVKFMLSNPADLKRLDALSGISFSKYVKGKLDEDIMRLSLQGKFAHQNEEFKSNSRGFPMRDSAQIGKASDVNNWFDD